MKKPLLTDEIIERANKGEFFSETINDDTDPYLIGDEVSSDPSKESLFKAKKRKPITKSRRIENEKRQAFQTKINRILMIVLLLLVLLIIAIIYF